MGCTNTKETIAEPAAPHDLRSSPANRAGAANGAVRTIRITPFAGYVIKTRLLPAEREGESEKGSEREEDKVFVNVFHHYEVEENRPFPLKRERETVTDKKGQTCFAYNIVIPTATFERGEQLHSAKEETVKRIMSQLCAAFPNDRFDLSQLRLPKVRLGFVSSAGEGEGESEPPAFEIVTHKPAGSNSEANTNYSAPVSASAAVGTNNSNNNSITSNNNTAGNNASSASAGANTNSANANNNRNSASERALPITPTQTQTQAQTQSTTPLTAAVSVTPFSSPAPASASATPAVSATASPSNDTANVAPLTAAALAQRERDTLTQVQKTETDARTQVSASASVMRKRERESAVVVVPGPPKMLGWLRKRGHIILNWKTRYFVLNNGFLTYYTESLALPPFGKNAKGQLCLAGFRILPAEKAHPLRIHLVFDPASTSREVVQMLREKGGSQGLPSDGEAHADELLLEAQSEGERESWVAAIEMHAFYLETAANNALKQKEKEKAQDEDSDTDVPEHQFRFQKADDFAREEEGALIDNASLNVMEQRALDEDKNNLRRNSFTSVSTAATNSTRMRQVRQSAVLSSVSTVHSQKWMVFLERDEEIVTHGITSKPNPLGVIHLLRELILVRRQPHTISESDRAQGVCEKRLIYVDTNTYEMKGEIRWMSNASKLPRVKKVNDQYFEVEDTKKQRFFPKDKRTVDFWVHAINSTPPV